MLIYSNEDWKADFHWRCEATRNWTNFQFERRRERVSVSVEMWKSSCKTLWLYKISGERSRHAFHFEYLLSLSLVKQYLFRAIFILNFFTLELQVKVQFCQPHIKETRVNSKKELEGEREHNEREEVHGVGDEATRSRIKVTRKHSWFDLWCVFSLCALEKKESSTSEASGLTCCWGHLWMF